MIASPLLSNMRHRAMINAR